MRQSPNLGLNSTIALRCESYLSMVATINDQITEKSRFFLFPNVYWKTNTLEDWNKQCVCVYTYYI